MVWQVGKDRMDWVEKETGRIWVFLSTAREKQFCYQRLMSLLATWDRDQPMSTLHHIEGDVVLTLVQLICSFLHSIWWKCWKSPPNCESAESYKNFIYFFSSFYTSKASILGNTFYTHKIKILRKNATSFSVYFWQSKWTFVNGEKERERQGKKKKKSLGEKCSKKDH